MKAVVLEIQDGYAAVLSADGSIARIRDRAYRKGEEIEMKKQGNLKNKRIQRIAALAAVCILLLGGGTYAYATPYYTVGLDVNPGLLIQANVFMRVLGVEAMNEDAQAVMENLNLKNMGLERALEVTLEQMEQRGYFEGEDNRIYIASASRNQERAEQLSERLAQKAQKGAQAAGIDAQVSAVAVGREMVDEARTYDMTPGRYNIITNLLEEEITEDNAQEYREMPMRDLMDEYEGRKKGMGPGPGEPSEDAQLEQEREQEQEQERDQDEDAQEMLKEQEQERDQERIEDGAQEGELNQNREQNREEEDKDKPGQTDSE